MNSAIKQMLRYKSIVLFIITLGALFVLSSKYNEHVIQNAALKRILNENADRMVQQAIGYKHEFQKMLNHLTTEPIIVNALINKDPKKATLLLQKMMDSFPYIRSVGLIEPDGKELITTNVSSEPQEINRTLLSKTYVEQRESKHLFSLLNSKGTNRLFLPTFLYMENDIKNNDKGISFARFTGQKIYDNTEHYVGIVFIEMNLSYLAQQLFSHLSEGVKAMIVGYHDRYISSDAGDNRLCPPPLSCSLHFGQAMIKKDKNNYTFLNGQYVAKRFVYLNDSKDIKEYNNYHDMFLVQYIAPKLPSKEPWIHMIESSVAIKLSLLVLILGLIQGLYSVINCVVRFYIKK